MGTTLSAQSDPQKTKVFTLEEAVEFALKNYPAVRASLERVRAAQAGVGFARTSYLPRTDLLWQSNRATDNNITGLTIPNSVIAPITGPVPASPSNRSASGSESGRGARGAEPRGGGSFAHPARCQCRHGQRLPHLARRGTDRACRASG